jgi:glycosyltransferase involved in cell wall biosynthesis
MLILLATYNGARYLPQLLESIAAQTESRWRLVIRDDGSTDATRDILADAARRDRRLLLIEDALGRQGVSRNFSLLMRHALELGASYAMLADQDDIWLPHKLAHSWELMRQAEDAAPALAPLLVHADLSVVDERLSMIHPSMTAYAGMNRRPSDPLRTLLVYNFVTGCTVLLNRPLLEAALPVPAAAVMHDWWLALCAAATGQIHYLPQPVALYRQHDDNTVGVHGFWDIMRPLSPYWQRRWKDAGLELARSIQQARSLERHLAVVGRHSSSRRQLVGDYCRLFEDHLTAVGRCLAVRRLAIGPRETLRQLSLAARIFRLPPMAPIAGGPPESAARVDAGGGPISPHRNASVVRRGETP